MVEQLSEAVQIRCLHCSEAFTRRGEQDRFCSLRCQREHSGVRRKALLLMAVGAAMFVGFGFVGFGNAGFGYLGIAGWVLFVGGMVWYGRETLRRD